MQNLSLKRAGAPGTYTFGKLKFTQHGPDNRPNVLPVPDEDALHLLSTGYFDRAVPKVVEKAPEKAPQVAEDGPRKAPKASPASQEGGKAPIAPTAPLTSKDDEIPSLDDDDLLADDHPTGPGAIRTQPAMPKYSAAKLKGMKRADLVEILVKPGRPSP